MIMAIMSSIISLTLIYISFHGVEVAADPQHPQSPITFLPPSPLNYQFDSPLSEEPMVKKKPPRIRPKNPPPAPHHPPPPPPPHVPTFDHFKLSLTWPTTFCKLHGVKCGNPVPSYLTIHGLWPNNQDTELKNCDKHSKIPVDWVAVYKSKDKLKVAWPQLRSNNIGEILSFWQSEWKTHGTCSYPLLNNVEYFTVALNLYNGVNGGNLLQKTNLLSSGKPAPRKEVIDALKEQTKFIPQIRCEKIGKLSYLLEIRFCFTATKSPQLQDCSNTRTNCLDDVYF